MKSGVTVVPLALAAAIFAISAAAAQDAPPPAVNAAPAAAPAFKNLKVFPKDISRAELISNMRFFSQSLGVRCTFCHVGVEGRPPSTYDFASDAKKEKLFARKMLLMVQRINAQDFGVQPGVGNMKVTCFTCHRGSTKPLTAPPAQSSAPASVPAPGANSAERGTRPA